MRSSTLSVGNHNHSGLTKQRPDCHHRPVHLLGEARRFLATYTALQKTHADRYTSLSNWNTHTRDIKAHYAVCKSWTIRQRLELDASVKRGRRVLTRAAVINIKHAGACAGMSPHVGIHSTCVVRARGWLVMGALRYATTRLVSGQPLIHFSIPT